MQPAPTLVIGEVSWERMIQAVQDVHDRLMRATAALNQAGVPYAVIGGNAVASWVSRVDKAAVRNTQDVDILLRRADLEAATTALTASGFIRQEVFGVEMFLDGPDAKSSNAIHVVFAGEKVKEHESVPAPDVGESQVSSGFRLINLEALVLMKLTSFRDKDRMHLRDLLGVQLIGPTWVTKFPPELAARLQQLIDTPGG